MNLTKAFWRLAESLDKLIGLPGEVRRLWIENDLIRARLDALEVAREEPPRWWYWQHTPAAPMSPDASCPNGGLHEYPQVWHAVVPAPCLKCGRTPPDCGPLIKGGTQA